MAHDVAMRSRDLQTQAARLISLSDALQATKPHEYRFHRILDAYVKEYAAARGEDEWFLHIDSRKHNPSWGRHMALHVVRREGAWLATLKINAKTREETLPALAKTPADSGLLSDGTMWNDLLIGILNMALWPEGENGWWKEQDPKKARVALVAYCALEYRAEKRWNAHAEPRGLHKRDHERTVYVSGEAYKRLQQDPPADGDGKTVAITSRPTHRSVFPDRTWQSSVQFMERILSRAEKEDIGIWPEVMPLQVLRSRGPLTMSEAIAHHLCVSPNGPHLKPTDAAEAVGTADWRSVRNWLKGAERKQNGRVKARRRRSRHRIPGQERGGDERRSGEKRKRS